MCKGILYVTEMATKQSKPKSVIKQNLHAIPIRKSKKSLSTQKVYHNPSSKLKKVHSLQKDSTLFCRYELKYRIRETKARAMAQYIQQFIGPDQYARKCPDYQYPISSLYLDSNQLHLCHETLEQKKNRFKLRVRCYDDNPQSPCFFEIKRRLNNVILKGRARLSKDQVPSIIQGNQPSSILYKKDMDIIQQFQFYVRMLQARPIILVRYMRQAFEDDSQNRVRITFDRGLSFRTVESPIVTINGPDWNAVLMDFVILEIKFTNYYPLWLNDLTKTFDLKQTAMSKYVSSVKQSCSLGYCSPYNEIGALNYG